MVMNATDFGLMLLQMKSEYFCDIIEEVAGIATFPLVPLMTAAAALQENLKVLAQAKSSKGLPRPVMSHDPFIEFIGFGEIDRLQQQFLRSQPQAAE